MGLKFKIVLKEDKVQSADPIIFYYLAHIQGIYRVWSQLKSGKDFATSKDSWDVINGSIVISLYSSTWHGSASTADLKSLLAVLFLQ